ncbi:hypothetical protein ACFL07_11660 [Pseudomonadota bacterium]
MPGKTKTEDQQRIIRFSDIDPLPLVRLLARFGMVLKAEHPGTPIPGSYWGNEEAGLVENILKVREDTPIHSILHESCHYICMDESRRARLNADAGGDYDEENAVCYLQILLADELPGMDKTKMMNDMDAWGYTFRLGSARAWFEQDAEDAHAWLLAHQLIDAEGLPTFRTRASERVMP